MKTQNKRELAITWFIVLGIVLIVFVDVPGMVVTVFNMAPEIWTVLFFMLCIFITIWAISVMVEWVKSKI